MKQILPFLQLIRLPNLFFFSVLICCIHKFVFLSLIKSYGITNNLSCCILPLLILTIVSIIAAGYIINDYFDIKIDLINRPSEVIVGNTISKQTAIFMFYLCNAFGILCGGILAWLSRSINVIILVLLVAGLLWFYSASYKRQFIIGPTIIAVICATIPFFIGLVDMGVITLLYDEWIKYIPLSSDLFSILSIIAGFIFFQSLIYKMIKDFQNEAGDRELECHTIPIVLGQNKAKAIVFILILICIIALGGLFLFIPFSLKFPYCHYTLLCLLLPQLYLLWTIKNATIPSDFKKARLIMKVIIVFDTVSLIFVPQLL